MTPTQRQAIKMARDYIAERPEDRKISAGKVVAALTAALAEQADDKADMTINLPPMPLPDKQGCEDDPMYGIQPVSYYTDKQMEAYAREAVRLNVEVTGNPPCGAAGAR